MCMRRRIMYEIEAFCLPEMRMKKVLNALLKTIFQVIPRIMSTSEIMFTCFHTISPWHLPFSNVICNIDVAINFDIFELVIVIDMVSNDVIIM